MDKHNKGIKLQRLRKKNGYTLEEVASFCEISVKELIDIEKGKRFPSDPVLEILLKTYKITELDLENKDFVDHKMRIKLINYFQIGLSLLMVLGYLLPFAVSHFGDGTTEPLANGFTISFSDAFGYTLAIRVVLIILIVQLLFHILLYTKLSKYSNILKSTFLLFNASSLILMYIVFNQAGYSSNTLSFYIILFLLHIGLTLYDMFVYKVSHDYIQDKGKNRRLFLLVVNIVLACFLIFILRDTLFDPMYHMITLEIVFFIVWGGYHLIYIFMNKTYLESRLVSTIALIIPPVFFGAFVITANVFVYHEQIDIATVFIILFMFLPALLVNTDFFIDLLRDLFDHGDNPDLEQ